MSMKTNNPVKKSSSQEVEKSDAGARSTGARLLAPRLLDSQLLDSLRLTADSRELTAFLRNKPGMSVKTNNSVKKSKSQEVEESDAGARSTGARLLTPGLLDSQLLDSLRLTADGRELTAFLRNKPGMSMKTNNSVKKSRSQEVESRMPGHGRAVAWGVNSSTSRLSTLCTLLAHTSANLERSF
jgi:hypothetical protein